MIDATQIKALQFCVANLRQNPPADPLGQLQAALLICEVEQGLVDAEEARERQRRRTTLPEGYRVCRRSARVWLTLLGIRQVAVNLSKREAHSDAWEHWTDPEAFEEFSEVEPPAHPSAIEHPPVLVMARALHVAAARNDEEGEATWRAVDLQVLIGLSMAAATLLGHAATAPDGTLLARDADDLADEIEIEQVARAIHDAGDPAVDGGYNLAFGRGWLSWDDLAEAQRGARLRQACNLCGHFSFSFHQDLGNGGRAEARHLTPVLPHHRRPQGTPEDTGDVI